MNYRESQYHHPLSYIALGTVASATTAVLALTVGGTILPALPLLAAALLVAILGRIAITVQVDALRIDFGWLRWPHRSFNLSQIEHARQCIRPRSAAIWGLGRTFGSSHIHSFGLRTGRGLEILIGDRRIRIGTSDPLRLKAALLPNAKGVDERPEYLCDSVPVPRRRIVRSDLTWGILNPKSRCRSAGMVGLKNGPAAAKAGTGRRRDRAPASFAAA